MSEDHDYYMKRALERAREAWQRGNRPVASIIVRDGEVIGEGQNSMFTDFDPSSHAEVAAIRQACGRLRTVDLPGATLYSTLEPCPMCLWCMQEAKIGRLVLGARHASVKRADLGRYTVESFLEFTARNLEIVTGVLAEECETIRIEWLRSRSG
ncbi:MAG: nucleoside deaminase [Betaproteobacteria bacterium]|nr:nucleoside deaminase [Betaproteobacteria bacterium]